MRWLLIDWEKSDYLRRTGNYLQAWLWRRTATALWQIGEEMAELRLYVAGKLLATVTKPLPLARTSESLASVLTDSWQEACLEAAVEARAAETIIIILLADASFVKQILNLPPLPLTELPQALEWELAQRPDVKLEQCWRTAIFLNKELANLFLPQQDVFAGLEVDTVSAFGGVAFAEQDKEHEQENRTLLALLLTKARVKIWQEAVQSCGLRFGGITLPEFCREPQLLTQFLLPPELQQQNFQAALPLINHYCRKIAAALVAFAILSWAVLYALAQQANKELAAAKQKAVQGNLWQTRLEEWRSTEKELASLTRQLAGLKQKEATYSKWEKLTQLLPAAVWLTEIHSEKNDALEQSALIVQGKAAHMQALSRYMNALVKAEVCAKAELIQAQDDNLRNEAGRNALRFQLRLSGFAAASEPAAKEEEE